MPPTSGERRHEQCRDQFERENTHHTRDPDLLAVSKNILIVPTSSRLNQVENGYALGNKVSPPPA